MTDRDGEDQAFVDAISEWPDIDDGPLTLAGFLLARIAEDERWARVCAEAYPGEWELSDRGWMAKVTADEPACRVVAELDQKYAPRGDERGGKWLGDYLCHIARQEPSRVLAECEAKRRIVASVIDPTVMCEVSDDVLRALALPYADHPDYRRAWRPWRP